MANFARYVVEDEEGERMKLALIITALYLAVEACVSIFRPKQRISLRTQLRIFTRVLAAGVIMVVAIMLEW